LTLLHNHDILAQVNQFTQFEIKNVRKGVGNTMILVIAIRNPKHIGFGAGTLLPRQAQD
jgi:hypothetical protein